MCVYVSTIYVDNFFADHYEALQDNTHQGEGDNNLLCVYGENGLQQIGSEEWYWK